MAGYFSYFTKTDYSLDDQTSKKLVNLAQYTTIFSKIADDVSFYSYYTMQDGERLDAISQKLYGTPDYYWTIPLINTNIINVFRDLPKDYPTLLTWLEKRYPGSAFKLAAGQSLPGKFKLGEIVSYNTANKAKVLAKHPTNGYIHVEVLEGTFPLNGTFTIVGAESGDTIQIANVVNLYDAPAYHTDANGNYVRWNSGQASVTTIREMEVQKNIEISQIKVIRPEYIYEVSQSFLTEMNKAAAV